MTDMRRGRWVVLAYYYAAALIGLVMVLIGIVGGLRSLVVVALPETSAEVRYIEPYEFSEDGKPKDLSPAEREQRQQEAEDRARTGAVADLLNGLILAGVGAPVLLWHLRQVRRQEPTAGEITQAEDEPRP